MSTVKPGLTVSDFEFIFFQFYWKAAKAEFHAHLAANRSQQAASSHDLVEDAELMSEDREIDGDNQGKISLHFFMPKLVHNNKLIIKDNQGGKTGKN